MSDVQANSLTRKGFLDSNLVFTALLGFMACLGQFSSDTYAPAMLQIASAFGVSINLIQLSMPLYMLGLCSSLLVFGSLSEAFGRRRPLLWGLVIMLVGSILCVSSMNAYQLLAGRVLQGIGAGAGASLWRAMFRDRFEGDALARYGAYMTILLTFVVPAAPMIGGFVSHVLGWRAVFWIIIGYALLILCAIYFLLAETSEHHHMDKLNLGHISRGYLKIIRSRAFIGYSLCSFCCYGGYFSWFTVAPVLLIKHTSLSSAMFGWLCFWGGALAMFFGGLIGGKLVLRFGAATMLRLGWSLMLIAGIQMLFGYWVFGLTIISPMIAMTLFYFGSTLVFPSLFSGAMQPFAKGAGFAGSLYAFLQMSGAVVIGAVASFLPADTPISLGLVFVLAPLISLVLFEGVVRPSVA
ncbi:multidrug effflux MFS transporter [Dongshaea marina]|uniref:multidrug effflux MFS transporter n=1 Tax=Dongshaea marina TaxID=2047966 RepID=UPI000D3E65CC|nr:multidrug effflux MFS transporter [Dongshaea marina]